MAMLPPALYPYIFSGSDFLAICQNASTERDNLIEYQAKEEEDCEMKNVSLEDKLSNKSKPIIISE